MHEELHQLWVTSWPLLAAAIAGCILGSLATWCRLGCRGRADFRAGVRHAEQLFMKRVAQDRRDDAPLSKPIPR